MTDPVKIVATIGPVTSDEEGVQALRDSGMNVARLNGSHATPEWHKRTIRLLRSVVADVPILLDMPGRKTRTAKQGRSFDLASGSEVILTSESDETEGEKVVVLFPALHEHLEKEDTLLLDDGNLTLTVAEIVGSDVICRVENSWLLTEAKGVHLPRVKTVPGTVTERDRDLIGFAIENGVDFVGVSFVESPADVLAVRELIGTDGPSIVAKIETQAAVDNVKEIALEADVLMIDRGDLSVETNIVEVALMQKRIIATANALARPVIVATELLHSMIENPTPTKAEVSDITNAVLDGASALMLSGETAVGKYPFAAVSIMRSIAAITSEQLQKDLDSSEPRSGLDSAETIPDVIGDAIGLICRRLPITKIVAVTKSGFAARAIALADPRQPIIGVTDSPESARRMNLLPGTRGVCLDVGFAQISLDHVIGSVEKLWRMNEVEDDDLILLTALGYPHPGNRMNIIEVHQVNDLKETFNWSR